MAATAGVTCDNFAMISITVNGQPQTAGADDKLADLLDRLALTGKRLAVEKNGEIVPKSLHGETLLQDGDRFEIVVAVGGG